MALLLITALSLSLLAGCGEKTGANAAETAETAPAASDTAADSAEEPFVEEPLTTAADLGVSIGLGGTGYASCAPDTVTGDVNGSEVSWQEYYYWLKYYARMFIDSAVENGVTLTAWDAENEMSNSMTNAEVVIAAAQYMIKYYHAIRTGAADMGVSLSDGDWEDLWDFYNSTYRDSDGDGTISDEEKNAFIESLRQKCVDDDFMMYLLETAKLTDLVFNNLYGENGGKYSDEATLDFIANNGYMAAKRIAILTLDPQTGEPLDSAEAAEKQALAERLAAELAAVQNADELNALFDEYIAQYSEDTGSALYPDGYVFTNDGSPLTTITASLEENYGLSGAEATSYGYEIVLRVPVTPDMVVERSEDGTGETLRYQAAEWEQQILVNAWTNTADVTWNEGFDTPDLTAIFG